MATTALGLTVPAGSDAFDPQGDMVILANAMRSRIIVPVANTTARTALVSAIDWTPAATEPLRVCRADAAVGWRDEITYDGSTWLTVAGMTAWAAFTPSWTNLTVGNGSVLARWSQTGTTVHVSLTLTFGSTSSVGGAVYFTLPVAPGSGTTTNSILGSVGLLDTSAGAWRAGGAFRSGSTVRLIAADGTNLGATSPWTWTTGDVITANLTYETA